MLACELLLDELVKALELLLAALLALLLAILLELLISLLLVDTKMLLELELLLTSLLVELLDTLELLSESSAIARDANSIIASNMPAVLPTTLFPVCDLFILVFK